jgi:hypothetical protein
MEEQHKIDSLVPKEPTILKDEVHLHELLCSYAAPMAYQNVTQMAVPLTSLR